MVRVSVRLKDIYKCDGHFISPDMTVANVIASSKYF